MTGEIRSKLIAITAFLLIVAACAAGIWRYGYGQALGQLEKQGRADLALATDRFTGQLRRYRELAVLMAEHPALAGLQAGGNARAANRLLLEAADKTGALGLIYANPKGEVLASAGEAPQNLTQSPYFRRAMTGALGSEHGIYGAQNRRAYVYAAPAFGPMGDVSGVLTVLVDVAELEWDWIGGQPAVFFTASGNVFLSNRSELLFWQTGAGGVGLRPGTGPVPDFSAAQVGEHEIWRMNWGAYLPRRALNLRQAIPVIGMIGHGLVDVSPALRLAGLQALVFALICLVFGAFLFLTAERRRSLARANAMLETRVAERTAALSGSNLALKQAQADLVQAGKLSALGQMSAGISHELNQPLMAIQQYAHNGAAFLHLDKPEAAADNLSRIAQLAARAARIIKNLRAFSRNESEPMGKVDLNAVINTAVELTGARLRAEGITLQWSPGAQPVYAWGGDVRLGQVFVNLINNAADAMAGQDGEKRIEIALSRGKKLKVTMRDTGPGIADPERIFEPFYSTKEVSSDEGMGLGLSISYGLVQSFGGNIRGANTETGAMFTVELEHCQTEAVA